MELILLKVKAYSCNLMASSISGAPPPGISPLFLTRDLTTQRAS
jgi:hypothetical protein